MKIKKLLVANRSEIAIRVFRAANELGIAILAIWAEEDKFALHRFKADESYQVGRGPYLDRDLGPNESCLSFEEVFRVAKLSGADAIHPGYGLLSESPEFAEACAETGITPIGPKPKAGGRLPEFRIRGSRSPSFLETIISHPKFATIPTPYNSSARYRNSSPRSVARTGQPSF